MPMSFIKRIGTTAKASLTSIKSMSSKVIPANFRAFLVAGAGPINMIVGSVPTKAADRNRARGESRKVGGEVNAGVFVQRDQGQVVGLIGHPPVQPSVFDDNVGRDVTLAAHLFPLGRLFGLAASTALTLSIVLARGGEFAFVLFYLAAGQGLLSDLITNRLILAVTLSMAATPVLYLLNSRLSSAVFSKKDERSFDAVEDSDHQVIIAVFGRFGQVIGRILAMRKIPFTALEASAAQVDFVRRYGSKVYYGDAGRLDLLRSAHVDRAKVFVLAVDDVEASVRIAETVTQHFPALHLVARARNRQHALRLMDVGASVVIRDLLLSSIFLAGEVLKDIGLSPQEAEAATSFFLKHDTETLQKQYAFHQDEDALMQSARDASEELRELFNSDANL